jgi:hypothetical protein
MKKFYLTLLLLTTAFGLSAQQTDTEVVATESEVVALDAQVEATAADGVDQYAEQLTPNQARKQRGFVSDANFVPKGQWIFGGTAAYSTHRNSNYKFAIINGIDSKGYTVSVSPMIGYALWRNMAVGVRFGYSRSLLALDNASLSMSGNDLTIDMFHQLKHSYAGSLFWRPYVPIGRSNRFAFFAEVQLNLSGGQSKAVAATGIIDGMQDYRGTYATHFGAQLALQPGIAAFITNNVAVELSIGVLGIGFERTKQVKNQIIEANVNSIDTNFKLNLLSVGFGMSFYL